MFYPKIKYQIMHDRNGLNFYVYVVYFLTSTIKK